MIYLGADHGGFAIKEQIKKWLSEWGYLYEDCGATTLVPDDDYPQYAFAVAEKVSGNGEDSVQWKNQAKGIVVCRSASGVVIAANKVKNIRAVAVFDQKMAIHARRDNDANVIGISADWTNESDVKILLKSWLETEFSQEERHVRRVNQIHEKELGEGCCGGGCC
jgi:ribose 5-phosphate isomerase B